MTAHRRPLGTGPNAAGTPPTALAPRLLPAERADLAALLDHDEHQEVPQPKGRRILGPGIATPPEGGRGEEVGEAKSR